VGKKSKSGKSERLPAQAAGAGPAVAAAPDEPQEVEKGVSAWAVAWRQLKKDRVAMFAAASLALLGLIAVTSPLLANDKPLWASYRGRWFFPAFKDYLDENIPIPFGIPASLQRSSGFFSPAYSDTPEVPHPGGQMLPDWRAIKREIDGPEGQARGDWYLGAPVPYYYKETSSAIKQLPFAPVARLHALDGRAAGRHIELVHQSVWESEWTRLQSFEPTLDLSGVAVVWSGAADRWLVTASREGATLNDQPLSDTAVALKEGDRLAAGGATLEFVVPTAHVMGTDDVGRDVCSRLIHGTVIAGSVGVVSVGIYVLIGVVLGAIAGYFRGWVDIGISRLIEIVICFPTFFLIITIVALWEPSIYNIMIALGLVGWTGVARLVRGEFLKAMGEDYVQAARALGLGHTRIIFKHILPNAIAPVFVSASFGVAGAILVESSLSFLGFGVQPPTASWGEVLRQGRNYINENLYHLVWFPGFCIFYTVTMFNLLGEGLRDALDPRLRQ
jgi:ABC-type dipeptide/oligopeptide/nickel transport system permease subunit